MQDFELLKPLREMLEDLRGMRDSFVAAVQGTNRAIEETQKSIADIESRLTVHGKGSVH